MAVIRKRKFFLPLFFCLFFGLVIWWPSEVQIAPSKKYTRTIVTEKKEPPRLVAELIAEEDIITPIDILKEGKFKLDSITTTASVPEDAEDPLPSIWRPISNSPALFTSKKCYLEDGSHAIRILLGIPCTFFDLYGRNALRTSWLQSSVVCTRESLEYCPESSVYPVFLINIGDPDYIPFELQAEMDKYNDIIPMKSCQSQANCSDYYRWFHYVNYNMSEHIFTHVGISQMDTFVDYFALIHDLRRLPVSKMIYGRFQDLTDCEPGVVTKDPKRPWCPRNYLYVSEEVFFISYDIVQWITHHNNSFILDRLDTKKYGTEAVKLAGWLYYGGLHDVLIPYALKWPHRAHLSDPEILSKTIEKSGTPYIEQHSIESVECRNFTLIQTIKQHPLRALLGIFSTWDLEKERSIIRETWWKFPGICRPPNIGNISSMEIAPSSRIIEPCDIGLVPYFVIGSPKSDSSDFEIDLINRKIAEENYKFRDILTLNISENMNYGKTWDWFNFASGFIRNTNYTHVGKLDMDAFVRPDMLVDQLAVLPRKGLYFGKINTIFGCDHNLTYPWCPRTHPYSSGQLYILTKDLVSQVTDKNNSYIMKNRIGIEDIRTSNWLYEGIGDKINNAITVMVQRSSWPHVIHPVKRTEFFHRLMNGTCCIGDSCCTDPPSGHEFRRLRRRKKRVRPSKFSIEQWRAKMKLLLKNCAETDSCYVAGKDGVKKPIVIQKVDTPAPGLNSGEAATRIRKETTITVGESHEELKIERYVDSHGKVRKKYVKKGKGSFASDVKHKRSLAPVNVERYIDAGGRVRTRTVKKPYRSIFGS